MGARNSNRASTSLSSRPSRVEARRRLACRPRDNTQGGCSTGTWRARGVRPFLRETPLPSQTFFSDELLGHLATRALESAEAEADTTELAAQKQAICWTGKWGCPTDLTDATWRALDDFGQSLVDDDEPMQPAPPDEEDDVAPPPPPPDEDDDVPSPEPMEDDDVAPAQFQCSLCGKQKCLDAFKRSYQCFHMYCVACMRKGEQAKSGGRHWDQCPVCQKKRGLERYSGPYYFRVTLYEFPLPADVPEECKFLS